MGRRLSLLHPFLVAAFPVLFLAAHNVAAVTMAEVWPPVTLSLAAAALLWLAVRPLPGGWTKAAVMTSILLAVFFS